MISLAKPVPIPRKNQGEAQVMPGMNPDYPRLELHGQHAHKLGLDKAKVGDEVHMHVKGKVAAVGESYRQLKKGEHPRVTLHLSHAENEVEPQEEKPMEKNPIEIKPANKGLLHRRLKVPQGEKIPNFMLDKAKSSADPSLRKQATFAKNASTWKH